MNPTQITTAEELVAALTISNHVVLGITSSRQAGGYALLSFVYFDNAEGAHEVDYYAHVRVAVFTTDDEGELDELVEVSFPLPILLEAVENRRLQVNWEHVKHRRWADAYRNGSFKQDLAIKRHNAEAGQVKKPYPLRLLRKMKVSK